MLTAVGNINTTASKNEPRMTDIIDHPDSIIKREQVGCPLVEGVVYRFVSAQPNHKKFLNHKYKLHRMIVDVPSYQEKCLVEAITGPDRGLWFSVTPENFARRYQLEGV